MTNDRFSLELTVKELNDRDITELKPPFDLYK
jgi:hypothetical protein